MDNYTQIPNWLIAKLYRADDLTFRELKILIFIIRKLYGFHKNSEKIPYSQIAEATGIDRRNVIKTIKSLESKGIISVNRKDKCANIIRLKGSGQIDTSASVKNSKKLVAKLTPSKENQKSDLSASQSFEDCEPQGKEILSVEELNNLLGDEYE